MAEAMRNWIKPLMWAVFSLSTGTPTFAQSGPDGANPLHTVQAESPAAGSLIGRLTDLHSTPLAGVELVLRNESTGAEARATTARNGAFRFARLDAGTYSLEAESARLGHGSLEGIVVTGGTEARVQAAIEFEPPAPVMVEAAAAAVSTQAPAGAASGRAIPAEAGAAGIERPIPEINPVAASGPLIAKASESGAARSQALFMVRPALSTSTPQFIASIESEPVRAMTPNPQFAPVEAGAKTAAATQPTISIAAPPITASPATKPVSSLQSSGLPQRAALETQSAAPELALAVAPPRMFPLPAGDAPEMAAAARSTANLQAADTTLTSEQLQKLPVSGRRWQEFLLDAPSASSTPDSSQAYFRGALEPAETTIDGASLRLAFGAEAGVATGSASSDPASQGAEDKRSASPAWTGGRGFGVSEAAVHEVTAVAGNAEAESARSANGQTNIRTEIGTDALHGQGFLFDRQNSWGARNPFTQWVQNTGTVAAPNFTAAPYTPPDHEMVAGLGMGSSIRRKKLFWFGAVDSYRRNDPAVATVKHPDQFFAQPSNAQAELLNAQINPSNTNPVANGLAAYWPVLEALDGLLGPAPRTATQGLGFGRIDWQAAERHRITVEATGGDWDAPGGGLTRVAESYGSHSFGVSHASQQWLLARWEAYLTPNLLAVTQGSAGRDILSAQAETPSSFENGFLQGGVNEFGQLPQIVVDSRYGFTIGNPARFGQGSYPDERLYHAQEMLDWAHNKLLVKGGFELDHNFDATSMLHNATGTYSYSTVQNFVSDALAFERFGPNPSGFKSNTAEWHNCDPTGKAWYATNGQLMGLGAVPCYSYFSQTVGPPDWHLSTNDWSGFATAQWQPSKIAVFSAGLRWEREQLPPPIAWLVNSDLPITEELPNLGNDWGPRVSLALGKVRGSWPVFRLAYGMYFGRTENATIETALTQTGSFKGDLNFFIRPTDGLNPANSTSAAPFFPDVLSGAAANTVTPGAVGFAPNFRNPEVHQAVASVEQPLPGRVELTASAMLSLGRRLPIAIDTNLTPPTATQTITYNVCEQTPTGPNNGQCGNLGLGPIKASQITVPFYASWPSGDCGAGSPLNSAGECGRPNPSYQQISEIESRANSTYEAAMIRITREGRHGLSINAHYTYAHAMDWNPNETTLVAGSDVLDPNPADFKNEYGTSDLDVRHSAAMTAIFEAPWKLREWAGRIANGWMLAGIGQFRSGLPYTMRTGGSLAEEFDNSGNPIVGIGPGMNGSGGDNRVYGVGNDGVTYNIGRNTFRYPNTWKADLRLAKRFNLGEMRQLEILAETFNLFNHQNVTELETTGYFIEGGSPPSALGTAGTLPTLNFLTGLKVNPTTGLASPAFGQPLNINATDFYRERQIQVGLRMRF
jgi:hypothetical protein